MLIVKKFGGKLLSTKERIFDVVNICKEDYEKGNDIILVLSAIGEKTDKLIDDAVNINKNFQKREMDMLLTTGEQIAIATVSMAFGKEDIPSISLNAFQVPIYTDSNYNNSQIINIGTKRIKQELSKRKYSYCSRFSRNRQR